MSAHTPGPWILTDGFENPCGWTVWGSEGRAVAAFPNLIPEAREQQKADARLIAAAPCLLAALLELRAACPSPYDADLPYQDAINKAEAAIAKATHK